MNLSKTVDTHVLNHKITSLHDLTPTEPLTFSSRSPTPLQFGKANRKIANRRLGRGEVEPIKD